MTDSCLYYFQYTTVSISHKIWKIKTYSLNLGTSNINCAFHIHLFSQDKDPIGIIPLENLCVRILEDAGKSVRCHLLLLSQWKK